MTARLCMQQYTYGVLLSPNFAQFVVYCHPYEVKNRRSTKTFDQILKFGRALVLTPLNDQDQI